MYKIDIRNLFRFDIIKAVQSGKKITSETFFVSLFIICCHLSITLYSFQNQMTRDKMLGNVYDSVHSMKNRKYVLYGIEKQREMCYTFSYHYKRKRKNRHEYL